jgi:diadenylate cyclase
MPAERKAQHVGRKILNRGPSAGMGARTAAGEAMDLGTILRTLVERFSWAALLDIALVAVGVYYLFLWLRGTRGIQLLKGVAVLLALLGLTNLLGLTALNWLLRQAILPGVVALIVLFQPELRRGLEQLGRGRFLPHPFAGLKKEEVARVVREVVAGARACADQRLGALIVFEREVGLEEFLDSAQPLDAAVSSSLIRTIFYPHGPLHDGAVIIRGDRIVAASAFLPLTERKDVGAFLGTRHRAAIGLGEITDAAAVVVSEEMGTISLSLEGKLLSDLSDRDLTEQLLNVLAPAEKEPSVRLWRRTRAEPKPGS